MKKNIDKAEVGKTLRQLRGIRTRTGVSRELGIPYSTLQAYEEGKRMPSGRVKQLLADYYNLPVEEIFFPNKHYTEQ